MNLEKLEQSVRGIVADLDRDEFVYQLLRAYNLPSASITRLKKGDYNRSENPGEVVWKQKLAFRVFDPETDNDLHGCIDRLKTDKIVKRAEPRFVIVTDFESLLAVDTKTSDTIETPFSELADHITFFLPWANIEKNQVQSENPADVKAAEKMGRLYDLIMVDNPATTDEERHALNMFLSRLLFCFFAEDTAIFESDQFTNAIGSHTASDGSDLQGYLQKLFAVLATEDRAAFPKYLRDFPYVNGGLFCDEYPVPKFNAKSRDIIIECGSLNWKAINPDIFGSMIQAVVHSEERGKMGMHYTSVVNIMKVIEPLFLNELRQQLNDAGKSKKKLDAVLDRLYNLRIFDPACGSGNFLIIAYKELCRLEIEVFRRLGKNEQGVQMNLFRSKIQLTQFYGIELDDFAHETAKLSLWLAEHQMNLEFKQVFGDCKPTLPLTDGGQIVCDNATRVDWEEVCPSATESQVFVLGNPPYLGYSVQSPEHKSDLAFVFRNTQSSKNLDYISCWFYLSAKYLITNSARIGFVSTNSISQGEQVAALWPLVLSLGVEIGFAHQSFKWTNHARANAGVICVVIGLQLISERPKLLATSNGELSVQNINPYLLPARDVFIEKRSNPLSRLRSIVRGSSPIDGGNLLMSPMEKDEFVERNPDQENLVRRYIGSREFINGGERYCFWLASEELATLRRHSEIDAKLKSVAKFRLKSKKEGTRDLAIQPHLFGESRHQDTDFLVVPRISSERRPYIPIGFGSRDTVISDLAFAVYDAPTWLFSVISSRMHMVWVRTVAGRMKSDYRYSSKLCYNTFPWPTTSDSTNLELSEPVFGILDAREQFPELTLADLYDPDKMPPVLREAHHEMDLVVERCYRKKPFTNDEERLEYLFKLYEKMIEAEKQAAAKPKRKARKGK